MTLFLVYVNIYHKEQLVTKEEAETVVGSLWGWRWIQVAVTKDGATSARIADILNEYGLNNVAQHIRGKCV